MSGARFRTTAALAGALALAGCVTPPPESAEAPVPARWHASTAAAGADLALPHGGSVQQLLDWWRQWHDPLLVELIDAAEQASPTLANAAARIAQARAGAVGARAALLPEIDAQAAAQRGPASTLAIPGVPANTVVNAGQIGLQLQWELDVFGGRRFASRAAQARLAGAQAQWHDARVSLAADTANQYFALRACQANLGLTERDAASRADTARLTGELARAGFAAPATWALTQASAAQAQAQRAQTEAQCRAAVKALVALTALDEDTLRRRLLQPEGRPPALGVDSVPAVVIAQRPDVYAAAQAVAAASGDVGQADAQRYPHLGLSGSIGRAVFNIPQFDTTTYSSTWSLGPLALTLPLFDGGRRRANVESARAQYEAAAVQYRATVRNAVREVETALSDLDAARRRGTETEQAVQGFDRAFTAANAKYKAGMGSLLELEDARRSLLSARMAQAALAQQTANAWIALYRALGGGWQVATNPTRADADLVAAGQAARASAAASAASASASAPTRSAAATPVRLPADAAATPGVATSSSLSSPAAQP